MVRLSLLAISLSACQPAGIAPSPVEPCLVERPEPGEVWVQEWTCWDQVPSSGEGSPGDLILANAWLQVVLRQPAHALTVPGIGGGTLVDATPWGFGDRLHEAIPLVDGAWLQLDTYEVLDDGLRLAGERRPLPGNPPVTGRGEVTWTLSSDGPTLMLEGSDGLWLHARAGHEPRDGALEGGVVTYATDGTIREDLGGAMILDDVHAIEVLRSDSRWVAEPDAIHITGMASDASAIQLSAGGVTQSALVIWDGVLDAWTQASIDGVRAVSPVRAPSPWTLPGQDLELTLGPPGTLRVLGPVGHRIHVQWTAEGRGALAVVDPGTVLDVGAGQIEVTLDIGPLSSPQTITVDVPANGEAVVRATGTVDTGHWLLTNLDVPSDRDHTVRDATHYSLRRQAWLGRRGAVLTATNDIADRADADIEVVVGSALHSEQGWRVTSWPWRSNPRRAAHGALPPSLVTVEDAISAAHGGPGLDRITVADLPFLAARVPFEEGDLYPDGIRLTAPLPSPTTAWSDWLTLGDTPRPVGPLTWLWVADPRMADVLDMRRAVGGGATVATTGPLLEIRIDDESGPVSLPEGPFQVTVGLRGGAVDHVALLDGTTVLTQWDGPGPWEAEVDAGRVTAVAWSDDGQVWAVTSARQRPPQED